jgi:hypothetical protein
VDESGNNMAILNAKNDMVYWLVCWLVGWLS